MGVGVWGGGLVVGAWGVAAELHCAGCMIVYCIHHHWEIALGDNQFFKKMNNYFE